MKIVTNKDGSKDLILTKKEFDKNYMVGCLCEYNGGGKWNSRVKVRIYGEVPDMKYCVLSDYSP